MLASTSKLITSMAALDLLGPAYRWRTREIEESISSHPNIAEVAVVGVADQLKGQVAMAFAVVKDASALVDS